MTEAYYISIFILLRIKWQYVDFSKIYLEEKNVADKT